MPLHPRHPRTSVMLEQPSPWLDLWKTLAAAIAPPLESLHLGEAVAPHYRTLRLRQGSPARHATGGSTPLGEGGKFLPWTAHSYTGCRVHRTQLGPHGRGPPRTRSAVHRPTPRGLPWTSTTRTDPLRAQTEPCGLPPCATRGGPSPAQIQPVSRPDRPSLDPVYVDR